MWVVCGCVGVWWTHGVVECGCVKWDVWVCVGGVWVRMWGVLAHGCDGVWICEMWVCGWCVCVSEWVMYGCVGV